MVAVLCAAKCNGLAASSQTNKKVCSKVQRAGRLVANENKVCSNDRPLGKIDIVQAV